MTCGLLPGSNRTGITVDKWSGLLDKFSRAAEDAMTCRLSAAERPVLEICGVAVSVDRCCYVDIEPMLQVMPEIPQEWQQSTAAGYVLAPWTGARMIKVMHLLAFISLRIFVIARQRQQRREWLAQGPWFVVELRDALMRVMSHLVEVHFHFAIVETAARHRGRHIPMRELFGAGQQRRAHRDVGRRQELLRAIVRVAGSDEVCSRTLVARHGEAALSRKARLFCYERESRRVFRGVGAAFCSWDGSNHGGPETLVGYLADVKLNRACYLRPEASDNYKYATVLNTPRQTLAKHFFFKRAHGIPTSYI